MLAIRSQHLRKRCRGAAPRGDERRGREHHLRRGSVVGGRGCRGSAAGIHRYEGAGGVPVRAGSGERDHRRGYCGAGCFGGQGEAKAIQRLSLRGAGGMNFQGLAILDQVWDMSVPMPAILGIISFAM